VLLDEAHDIGAAIKEFAVESSGRELALNLSAPMTIGNAGVISRFLHSEIVFSS
jgi:hypothetical protein